MRMKTFFITHKGSMITRCKAPSAAVLAKALGGRITHSCPGWALVKFDRVVTDIYNVTVNVKEVSLMW